MTKLPSDRAYYVGIILELLIQQRNSGLGNAQFKILKFS